MGIYHKPKGACLGEAGPMFALRKPTVVSECATSTKINYIFSNSSTRMRDKDNGHLSFSRATRSSRLVNYSQEDTTWPSELM